MRAEKRLASAFEEFILPYDALRTAAPDAALLELHKGETSFDREAIEAEIMTGGPRACARLFPYRWNALQAERLPLASSNYRRTGAGAERSEGGQVHASAIRTNPPNGRYD